LGQALDEAAGNHPEVGGGATAGTRTRVTQACTSAMRRKRSIAKSCAGISLAAAA
jgi:hypothetical protein